MVIDAQVDPKRPFAQLAAMSSIPATSWQNFMRGRQRPTHEMIEAVCTAWPEFAFWVATGQTDTPLHWKPRTALANAIPSEEGDIHLIREGDTAGDRGTWQGVVTLPLDSEIGAHAAPNGINWGYLGAGSIWLAWNVLVAAGMTPTAAYFLRTKFAEDVVAQLPIRSTVLPASAVREWLAKNQRQIAWAKKMSELEAALAAAPDGPEKAQAKEAKTAWRQAMPSDLPQSDDFRSD